MMDLDSSSGRGSPSFSTARRASEFPVWLSPNPQNDAVSM